MPVEMIGWIAPRVSSEIIPAEGPPFDADVIAETARIHEQADFAKVLIGYFSDAPDGVMGGAHAAGVTDRLAFLLAHRPGFVAPTVAARKPYLPWASSPTTVTPPCSATSASRTSACTGDVS